MENQTKKWFIRGLLLLIILTMSCTCMPGRDNNNINENEGDDIPDVTVEVELDDTPTPMPTNTEVVVPTDTIEPTMDSAAATELAELLESYLQPSQREWSVPAYPGAEYIVDDRDEDSDAEDIVERDARIFALTEPFYYEFYTMPSGLRYADVQGYYKEELPKMGYKLADEKQDTTNEIYLLTFVNASNNPQSKIVFEYWRNGDLLLIMYKNPE